MVVPQTSLWYALGENMKQILLTLLGMLLVVCLVFISYSEKYTITEDKKELEDHILRFINRPTVVYDNIKIEQELDLDNKKYVFFVINKSLGDAELTKGFNNKFKIESVGYNFSSLKVDINKTNSGKYLILRGKKYDNRIAYAKILFENNEYKIDIPQQEYFMAYCSVPSETQSVIVEFNKIKFYDVNDVDITE